MSGQTSDSDKLKYHNIQSGSTPLRHNEFRHFNVPEGKNEICLFLFHLANDIFFVLYHGTVDIIPQWRGYTKNHFTILVMMDAVIDPQ